MTRYIGSGSNQDIDLHPNGTGLVRIKASAVGIDDIIDDDTFATATDTNIPTAESVKAYVDGLISGDVQSVTGTTNQIDVNNTDAQNPILSLSSTLIAPGTIEVGNLLFDTNTISSTDTNGDLILTPDGTGNLVLDGLNWPQADGTAGYVLATDGAGQLSWIVQSSGNPGGTSGQIQYNNGGAFGGDSGFTTDGNGDLNVVGRLQVDNIVLNGNTIASNNTNGNILLRPNGTGFVGINTTTPESGLDIVSDSMTVGSTRADATTKQWRERIPNYNNADGYFGYMFAQSTSGNNSVFVGGGSSLVNSATLVHFVCAANQTTPTGTIVGDFTIDGLRLGAANSRVTTILNDNTMAAASGTNLYTGGAIKDYVDAKFETGTFDPTITFTTPGDLNVDYLSRSGSYTRIVTPARTLCFFTFFLAANTFTFTTASGDVQLGGLPFAGVSTFLGNVSIQTTDNFSWGTNGTFLSGTVMGGSSWIILQNKINNGGFFTVGAAEFTSGQPPRIRCSGWYYTS